AVAAGADAVGHGGLADAGVAAVLALLGTRHARLDAALERLVGHVALLVPGRGGVIHRARAARSSEPAPVVPPARPPHREPGACLTHGVATVAWSRSTSSWSKKPSPCSLRQRRFWTAK